MIQDELKKHIRKLVGVLKDEEALQPLLKARLTKREYKLLTGWSEGSSVAEICEKLKLEEEGYGELSAKLIKKLNQEKLKQELVD